MLTRGLPVRVVPDAASEAPKYTRLVPQFQLSNTVARCSSQDTPAVPPLAERICGGVHTHPPGAPLSALPRATRKQVPCRRQAKLADLQALDEAVGAGGRRDGGRVGLHVQH